MSLLGSSSIIWNTLMWYVAATFLTRIGRDRWKSVWRHVNSWEAWAVDSIRKKTLYNVLGIRQLFFICCFHPPSEKALKAERGGLQYILRGPWKGIPLQLLWNLRDAGFPIQARHLLTMSRASKLRIGWDPSGAVERYRKQVIDTYWDRDDVDMFALSTSHYKCPLWFYPLWYQLL